MFPALMPFLYFQQPLFEESDHAQDWSAEPLAEKTSEVDEERALKERVRLLRGQRDELQAKLQRGARQENEVLTAKVLAAQQEFLALQGEFKTMKEEYNQRLEGLRLALEEQQIAAEHSSRRVICAEDLVKFHQEQSRLMTSHWRQQCQMKDESIRNLNRQLIEYSTDWQHLGHQRQTEAGLSHEHFCLEDRHRRLLEHQQLLGEHTERLEAQLAEVQTEERSLREELAKSAAAPLEEAQLEEALAERQTQTLEFLRAQRRGYEEEAAAKRSLPGSHRCIWRDELDVREAQLEKIATEQRRIAVALERIQAALAEHSAQHQEAKGRHGEAESVLREKERLRMQRQKRCQELRRTESAVRRLVEVLEAQSSPGAASSQPG